MFFGGLFRKQNKAPEERLDTLPIRIGDDVVFLGSAILTGAISGNFYSQDTLTVARGAVVRGLVAATDCLVHGRVDGDIICIGNLRIGANAEIIGSILARQAQIDPGCVIHGNLQLESTFSTTILAEKIALAKAVTIETEQNVHQIRQSPASMPDLPSNDKPKNGNDAGDTEVVTALDMRFEQTTAPKIESSEISYRPTEQEQGGGWW